MAGAMRVMHVITNLTATGGAEAMLLRLLRLRKDEADVVVSVRDVSAAQHELFKQAGIEIHCLQGRSAIALPLAMLRLSRLLRAVRPDAVMCWMYHAMVVGQVAASISRTEVPVYWNVRQSLDDPTVLTVSTRIALRAARALSRWPAGIVFNSIRALKLHREFGFRNGNAVVIPNGFDIPSSESIPTQRRAIGIAGRLHPQKDHATFFAAAAAVHRTFPEVRFLAAGRGLTADNDEVARMLRNAGLPTHAIELLGNLTDMPAFYRSIDLLVLSSRTEGFPNVVAEAMSFGKPVIATDVGDAAEIVADAGRIVPARSPTALADAICQMLALDGERYAQLARAARTRIRQNYSIERVADAYRHFFGSVAAPSDQNAMPAAELQA
ncbi:MAG TPA: glycosyltransferase [Nitrospiraceae bacterium]|nr:glycosyltransferase [Nitrospiraceae bacterium]